MSLSDWMSLAVICVLGATSPGPSLAVILAVTRERGRPSGISASLGHGLGIFFYALLAATSLSYIITNHQRLFTIIQLAGALLLIWIGGRTLLGFFRQNQAPTETLTGTPTDTNLGNSFATGFVIAVFNPKISAFFASLFSQFLVHGQGLGLHVAMASLAGFIDLAAYIIIVVAVSGRHLRPLLDTYHRLLDLVLGCVLLALGLSLIFSKFIFTS